MHLNSPPPSNPQLRAEFDDWVADGPRCLSAALLGSSSERARPMARVLEPSVPPAPAWRDEYAEAAREENRTTPRCYQWVHIPSPAGRPDLVAIIFTERDDLLVWRASEERREWLARGERFVRDRVKWEASRLDVHGVLTEAHIVQLHRDDGSLGGWLPSGAGPGATPGATPAPPPPAWKVAATVLVAMYPMQEANRLLVLPALGGLPLWEALGPAQQLWAVCAWTCACTTVALLPLAKSFTERIGFIGGDAGCPEPTQLLARPLPLLLLAYAATIGVGAGLVVALDRGGYDARPPIRRGRGADRTAAPPHSADGEGGAQAA